MKRTMILFSTLLAVCLIYLVNAKPTAGGDDWKKAKNNAWPGVINEQTYMYKLDANAKLWWSPDGKKWEADADGMWADKEGSFFKIDGHKLRTSADGGNTWSDSPEWKWMAVDGNWYKLDKDWIVWVSKVPAGAATSETAK